MLLSRSLVVASKQQVGDSDLNAVPDPPSDDELGILGRVGGITPPATNLTVMPSLTVILLLTALRAKTVMPVKKSLTRLLSKTAKTVMKVG
jgi:hypothetical protein